MIPLTFIIEELGHDNALPDPIFVELIGNVWIYQALLDDGVMIPIQSFSKAVALNLCEDYAIESFKPEPRSCLLDCLFAEAEF